ncbi:hypothetical protein HOU08_gp281 [Dickeya phage vB_DsoM_JA29]|uniref:Uncharacterized protein n=1 Tax=Dickeya phage vB_DsoM_JA29 TaxID=2283031 RepID=A0A384ZXP9_9CAUD|nr:hypothetical protein HOU08_gp281 [Dickeya phage vB_DsoM_JA29]AXG67007.1 hypothetical protein JA29_281 [Dickeya phage vB_DsoM_JA29]
MKKTRGSKSTMQSIPKNSLQLLKAGKSFYVSISSGDKHEEIKMTDDYKYVKSCMVAVAYISGNPEVRLHLGRNIMDDSPDTYIFEIEVSIKRKKSRK